MAPAPKPTVPSFPFDVLLARIAFHSLPLDFQDMTDAASGAGNGSLLRMIRSFDLLHDEADERAIVRRIRTPIGSWGEAAGRVGSVEAVEIDKHGAVVARGHLSGLNIPPGSWVRLVPLLRWRSGRVSMRAPRWYGDATEPRVTRYTAADAPRGAVLAFSGFRLYVDDAPMKREARSRPV